MCRRGLREAPIGLHLHRVDEVREFDRVLNEKDRDIVADQIPVAFLGIELDGKTANVPWSIDRTGSARDSRESCEEFGALTAFGQDLRGRISAKRLCECEIAMHSGPAGMHNALRNPFMIEVVDLFTEDEVFEKCRARSAGLQ